MIYPNLNILNVRRGGRRRTYFPANNNNLQLVYCIIIKKENRNV